MMSSPIVEARNVARSYGRGEARFNALKGVSLAIHGGESVAIVGKSGSGKSTLMHLLALLDKPTSGTVLIHGSDAATLSARRVNRLRGQNCGFVFQQFFLTSHMSVLENVILPLKITGVRGSERRRRGLEALDALGLSDKAKKDANDLSGGEKQRVVIARALVTNPELIFADEPTGNLDSSTGEIVENMLFELQRDRGITLVVVTHDPDLAARCDRRLQMHDGLIVTHDVGASA